MNVPLHEAEDGRSSDDASRPAALLVGRSAVFGQAFRSMFPIFSLLAPCLADASPVSLRRGTITTDC